MLGVCEEWSERLRLALSKVKEADALHELWMNDGVVANAPVVGYSGRMVSMLFAANVAF